MPSATINGRGQVTVPGSIRRALGVAAGDRLDFVLEGDGRVVVQPVVQGLTQLKGLLHRPGRKRVSLRQMKTAIARQGR